MSGWWPHSKYSFLHNDRKWMNENIFIMSGPVDVYKLDKLVLWWIPRYCDDQKTKKIFFWLKLSGNHQVLYTWGLKPLKKILSSKLVKFQICLIFLCKLTRLTLKGHNSDIIWTTGMFDTSMESSCHPLSAYVTVWPLRSKIKGKKITYMRNIMPNFEEL